MKIKYLLPLLAAIGLASSAAALTINSATIDSSVTNGSSSAVSSFSGTSIPTSFLLDATEHNGDYSRVQIDYSGFGDQVTISYRVEQKRSGGIGDYAQGFVNTLGFTVATNASYELSGSYAVKDVTTAGRLSFSAYLNDVTAASGFIALSQQSSYNTVDESFTLGANGGDNYNGNIGSLTGSLIAGHSYKFLFSALTQANPDADGGATAFGNVMLKIGGGAPVPDSGATFMLLGASVMGLAALRRRGCW